jgi:alpha-D-xyloside xylohydrolase
MNQNRFERSGEALRWRRGGEQLTVEPWGPGAVRVRATVQPPFVDGPSVLQPPAPAEARPELGDEESVLRNGRLEVRVARTGWVRFFDHETGAVLLEEEPGRCVRRYRHVDAGAFQVEARFRAYEGERLYGLGQHTHGLLDQKGCVLDLEQSNTETAMPVLVSSRGYGFLWHQHGTGRVELGANTTRWVADAAHQIEYVVFTGGDFFELMARYAGITGHPPMMPDYAAGFWQSKLRYKSQEEVLGVARGYRDRGLPLDVIVIDWFHWTRQGEWRFDPARFPDPAAMVRELREMGVELAVSVWPTVNPRAETHDAMEDRGLLVRNERGYHASRPFKDNGDEGTIFVRFYDPTNPEARAFLWDRLRANYHAHGARVFWLDCSEPEWGHNYHDHERYHLGNGAAVANLLP